ncbi:hypothetical protein CDAR_51251 [Caerostris darwini]|uniref:Uncharacterized protein n=1 Tax=Caerostris darwini TaxID=1538125 RepID=A0AAV4U5W6_9ARAC|nr:hypothetical protein CDAR_51251 [Caerostris darwini]
MLQTHYYEVSDDNHSFCRFYRNPSTPQKQNGRKTLGDFETKYGTPSVTDTFSGFVFGGLFIVPPPLLHPFHYRLPIFPVGWTRRIESGDILECPSTPTFLLKNDGFEAVK